MSKRIIVIQKTEFPDWKFKYNGKSITATKHLTVKKQETKREITGTFKRDSVGAIVIDIETDKQIKPTTKDKIKYFAGTII